jgi:hypothetical protein
MNYYGKPFPLVIFYPPLTSSIVNEAGGSMVNHFVSIQEDHSQRKNGRFSSDTRR